MFCKMGLRKQPKALPVATQHVISLLNSHPLRYNLEKYPLPQMEPLCHCTCTTSSYMYFSTHHSLYFLCAHHQTPHTCSIIKLSCCSLEGITCSHICCHIIIKLRLSYFRFTNLDFTVTFSYQLPGTPCFSNTWHT